MLCFSVFFHSFGVLSNMQYNYLPFCDDVIITSLVFTFYPSVSVTLSSEL